ncbi:MAG TPA: PEGA domain-containing protein [Candidatus Nanoperiomorbaceae bacterium]|nr:PEGA domain-containing protein [Candidatus Nanoperiomorbaceae bacterium]
MLRYIIKPIHIIIASVLLLVLVAVIVWPNIYQATNPITISKVPADATVYINDKEVSGDRTNLANGIYTVKATKDGFADYEGTVIIDDDSKYIVVALDPESNEAKQWAEDNQDAYLAQESTTGSEVGESGALVLDRNPIIDSLPIQAGIYAVGYVMDNTDKSGNSIIVTIDAPGGYRNAAIKDIYGIGSDPADYNIQIEDYTNPFKESK